MLLEYKVLTNCRYLTLFSASFYQNLSHFTDYSSSSWTYYDYLLAMLWHSNNRLKNNKLLWPMSLICRFRKRSITNGYHISQKGRRINNLTKSKRYSADLRKLSTFFFLAPFLRGCTVLIIKMYFVRMKGFLISDF